MCQAESKYMMSKTLTAYERHQQMYREIELLYKNYSDDPHKNAIYACGLLTSWLARLALEDMMIRREIADRQSQIK